MGTVTRLTTAAQGATLGHAIQAFLATLGHPEARGTRRVYGNTLRAMATGLGEGMDLADLTPASLREWFAGRWGESKPATWNTNRGALRSFLSYCGDQGWVADATALMRGVESRTESRDRDRALSRTEVDALLKDKGIPLRERTLWRMLYETAARSAEVLRLDVEDLDMPNRCARVRRKGGDSDIVVWQTETARLLPRLIKGRKSGPVFLTERRSAQVLAPGDTDSRGYARLSYEQAEHLFKEASGGKTLHQLRHSALTHAAEDGVSTPMLMARSGHTSVRSLVRYARVSAEALMRHQAATDPARRR